MFGACRRKELDVLSGCAFNSGRLAGRRRAGRSHPRNSRPNHHLGVVESRLTGMRACRDCSWDRHYPGDVGYLEGDTAPGARTPPSGLRCL